MAEISTTKCLLHGQVQDHMAEEIIYRTKIARLETKSEMFEKSIDELRHAIDSLRDEIKSVPGKIFLPIILANVVSIGGAVGLLVMLKN